MKKLLLILFFSPLLTVGQNNLDSFWNIWQDQSQLDTTRLKALDSFIREGFIFNQPDSAFYFADIQYEFAKERDLTFWMAKALRIKGITFSIKGDQKKAITHFNQALVIYTELDDAKGIGSINSDIGSAHRSRGDLSSAISYQNDALRIAESTNDTALIHRCLSNIGTIYSDLGNTKKALLYFERNLKGGSAKGNAHNYLIALNNAATCHQNLGNYETALNYLTQGLKLEEVNPDIRIQSNMLEGIGQAKLSLGDTISAMKYFELSLSMHREVQNNERIALDLLNIAKIYFNKGRLDSAEIYSTESLEIAKKIESAMLIADISQLRYELFKVQGDNKAFEMLEMMMTYRDSLKNEETERSVIRQEFKHEYELQKSLDEKQKKIDEKLNRIKITSILIALGVVIIFFLFYRSNIIKKAKLQNQLAANEKEILNLKIQEENRNVQALSHELMVKQDFSEKLIHQLGQIESLSKPEIKNIEFFIQNELDVKSSRAELQNQMGNLSSNFYNELKINHPTLSDIEIKVSAMVVMNMSNKEIAISRNMEPSSVRVAKNRIKKKIGLPADTSLLDYLTGLL
ncbi:MAG: tetratricopeptide repeat protein [Vicingaceae bacterium]|nr:tetratricopeptide repeat protein [Vicingaceae bacterium]